MRIKNLTNSPYSLVNAAGDKVIIPARGEIEIDPHPMHASQYKNIGYFQVSESEPEPEPKKPDDDIDALREEYEELSGESADGRWSVSRLKSEIDKLS